MSRGRGRAPVAYPPVEEGGVAQSIKHESWVRHTQGTQRKDPFFMTKLNTEHYKDRNQEVALPAPRRQCLSPLACLSAPTFPGWTPYFSGSMGVSTPLRPFGRRESDHRANYHKDNQSFLPASHPLSDMSYSLMLQVSPSVPRV